MQAFSLFVPFVHKGWPTRLTFVKNQSAMIKLLFWGLIGYAVYRFFQMREMVRENRLRQHYEEQLRQQKFEKTAAPKSKGEGEFIDYEELK
jgi:hypothetical protein